MKERFNALPKPVKVIIYSGVSSLLAMLLADLSSVEALDVRAYLAVPLTVLINLVAYVRLQEDN